MLRFLQRLSRSFFGTGQLTGSRNIKRLSRGRTSGR